MIDCLNRVPVAVCSLFLKGRLEAICNDAPSLMLSRDGGGCGRMSERGPNRRAGKSLCTAGCSITTTGTRASLRSVFQPLDWARCALQYEQRSTK
ncbi:hypothetical protein AAFF_G00190820 [Aldrovandia affinis]|uniref:Uncharacterized protein n=1 Tax=Aldrovandia affinis TaxID=143900 RepID=A0AAD7RJG6_9TELE|nr:hypothetical protein AAFF_G00190820 [Aldrovandia affinis]